MRILKKIIFLVLLLFCMMNIPAQAVTLVTTNQDFYYERIYLVDPTTWYYNNPDNLVQAKEYDGVFDLDANLAIPYFNFDLNPYMSAFNNSTTVTLNLITTGTGITSSTIFTPATFDVFLTDWNPPPLDPTITTSAGFNIVPISRIGSAIGTTTINSPYGADELLQISLNKGDIATYLASHSNNLKILLNPDQDSTICPSILTAQFYGLPSSNAGQIELDADMPVPEPSSIILGLMGLGGMLVFNKNRGKLS